MAKSAVDKLIDKAKKIEPKSVELETALSALIGLGARATHTNAEFIALKDLVAQAKQGNADESNTDAGANDEVVDSEAGKDAGVNTGAETGENMGAGEKENTGNGLGAEDKGTADTGANDAKEAPKKKINHDNTRMIGSMFYNKKDNYKKGFPTANDCSLHHNGYRD